MKKHQSSKKILVVGSPDRQEEFARLNLKNSVVEYSEEWDFSDEAEMMDLDDLYEVGDFESALPDLDDFDVVFDLNLDENTDNLSLYLEYPGLTVVGCAVKLSLGMMMHEYKDGAESLVFGMNALPTFIDRPVMEMSLRNRLDFDSLADLMDDLGLAYEIVEDRVGMVTPRVVCMIINEAGFTVGEGTANALDIDRAMKLGTNYPMGPFEWADKIGLGNVVNVLSSLQIDSSDGRYKIAPILKTVLLDTGSFFGK